MSETKAPWDGGPTRMVKGTTFGVGPFYDWFLCKTCPGGGMWHWEKNDPGFWTVDGVGRCRECHFKISGAKRAVGYAAARPSDFPPAVARVLEGWPFSNWFLFIQGTTGAGKTHACHAIKNALAGESKAVRILNAPEARQTFIGAEHGRENLIQAWSRTELLALDDISAASGTDGWVEAFHLILDNRINADRPTILTAACGRDEIGRLFGQAIGSRLKIFSVLWIGDKDRRNRRMK